VRGMRHALLCAVLGLLGAAFPAGAEEAFGRVDALYQQAAPGVLVAAKLRGQPDGVRWADVDVGGRRVLVRVPDDMRVAAGDRIAVRLGAPRSNQLATILPTTTVSRALGPDPNASIGR
jgi:hypothetical protein